MKKMDDIIYVCEIKKVLFNNQKLINPYIKIYNDRKKALSDSKKKLSKLSKNNNLLNENVNDLPVYRVELLRIKIDTEINKIERENRIRYIILFNRKNLRDYYILLNRLNFINLGLDDKVLNDYEDFTKKILESIKKYKLFEEINNKYIELCKIIQKTIDEYMYIFIY